MFVGEVSARLGVDSSGIASDMAKANSAFAQGASQAGDDAGAKFGDKFTGRLKERFMGRAAFSGLFVGLGLDPKAIADTIAGAIVGGSKKGWEEALAEAEKGAKLLDELWNHGKTRGQREAALRKTIQEGYAEAQSIKPGEHYEMQGFGQQAQQVKVKSSLTADQSKAQDEAINRAREAEIKLNALTDEDARDKEKYDKEHRDSLFEELSIKEKIVMLEKEENELLKKLAKGTNDKTLSEGESLDIRGELGKKDKEIFELNKRKGEEEFKSEGNGKKSLGGMLASAFIGEENKMQWKHLASAVAATPSIPNSGIYNHDGSINSSAMGTGSSNAHVAKTHEKLDKIHDALKGKFTNQ